MARHLQWCRQYKALRLLPPLVSVLPQIGNDGPELGNQGISRGIRGCMARQCLGACCGSCSGWKYTVQLHCRDVPRPKLVFGAGYPPTARGTVDLLIPQTLAPSARV